MFRLCAARGVIFSCVSQNLDDDNNITLAKSVPRTKSNVKFIAIDNMFDTLRSKYTVC